MQPTSMLHHTTTTLYLYPLLDRKRTRTFRKSIQVTFLPERRNVKCYTTNVAENDNAKLTFTNEKITQRILYSCLINTGTRPLSPPPPQQVPTAPWPPAVSPPWPGHVTHPQAMINNTSYHPLAWPLPRATSGGFNQVKTNFIISWPEFCYKAEV